MYLNRIPNIIFWAIIKLIFAALEHEFEKFHVFCEISLNYGSLKSFWAHFYVHNKEILMILWIIKNFEGEKLWFTDDIEAKNSKSMRKIDWNSQSEMTLKI